MLSMPWTVEEVEQIPGGSRLVLVGESLTGDATRPITLPLYGSFTYKWSSDNVSNPRIEVEGATYDLGGSGTSGSGLVEITGQAGGPGTLFVGNLSGSRFYLEIIFDSVCEVDEGSPVEPADGLVFNDADGRWYAFLTSYGKWVSVDPIDFKFSGAFLPDGGYLDTSGASSTAQVGYVLDKPAGNVILQYVTVEALDGDLNQGSVVVTIDGEDYPVALDNANRVDSSVAGGRSTWLVRFNTLCTPSDGLSQPVITCYWSGLSPTGGEVRAWAVLRYAEDAL